MPTKNALLLLFIIGLLLLFIIVFPKPVQIQEGKNGNNPLADKNSICFAFRHKYFELFFKIPASSFYK